MTAKGPSDARRGGTSETAGGAAGADVRRSVRRSF